MKQFRFPGGGMKNPDRASRPYFRGRLPSGCGLAFLALGCCFFSLETSGLQAAAQQQAHSSPTSANNSAQEPSGEMVVKDEVATYRVNVRLVLARVVVRDAHGHAVGNLRKEDFELLDNGKPQVISHFAVEKLGSPVVSGTSEASDNTKPAGKPLSLPERYVAYLFDDLHLSFEDINRIRAAAEHRVDNMEPTDRIAIFSTSGQTTLDFTDDRAKLHETLGRLQPRPMFSGEIDQCPKISFYMADLIVNKHDSEASLTAANDYLRYCSGGINSSLSTSLIRDAESFVQGVAALVLTTGQHESRLAIGALKDAVRRISVMPGQRSLIVLSPGFLTPQLEYDYTEVIDHALQAQVTINTLDARGLYVVVPYGGASQGHADVDLLALNSGPLVRPGSYTAAFRSQLDLQSASAQSDLLAVLANSTGGTFFHNNNDMDEGLRRVAETPESYYVLGFTPQNLKMDGKFHALQVNLKVREKYDLQVRRGYYAPNRAEDAIAEAKREIEDELLSSEELHDLPVELHTQFFKATDDAAKLTVVARLDVKRLRYKKAEGRNQNDVTLVTALFDRNGNFLQANQKLLQMRWKDETLQGKLGSGIALRTSFDVKPGSYMVRIVARDSEQQLMSAENGGVEIP
jgi:VWFA-related protein